MCLTAHVQFLWPNASDRTVSDAELEQLYAYPEDLTRPWVQANFVSSVDGAVSVDGKSEGLSHPADKRVFALGRDLADVVLVGASTAITEAYRGVQPTEVRAERRARLGLSPVPPIAVVSGRCTITPDAPLLTNTRVAPIVFTSAAAPQERTRAAAGAGADVVVVGDERVHLPTALAELDRRGLRRVDCEGGPRLFASLIADDLVDQLCLTLAPLLAGVGADRIAMGRLSEKSRRMRLASVLHEDGFLMLRYMRDGAR